MDLNTCGNESGDKNTLLGAQTAQPLLDVPCLLSSAMFIVLYCVWKSAKIYRIVVAIFQQIH